MLQKKEKLYSAIIWIILLDLMCLPVIPVIHLPISVLYLFVICLLGIYHFNYKEVPQHRLLTFFLFSIILSTALSFFIKPNTAVVQNGVISTVISVHSSDIKRAVYLLFAIFIFVIVYTCSLKIDRKKLNRIISKCLSITLAMSFLLLILSVFNHTAYLQFRNMIFGTSVDLSGDEALSSAGYYSRYLYILLDPNNACYFIQMIAAFQIGFIKAQGVHRWTAMIALIVIPFATQSTGGIIATFFILFYLLYSVLRTGRILRSSLIVISVFAAILVFVAVLDMFLNLQIFSSIFGSQSAVLDRWRANSMSGRTERYLYMIKNFFPYPIGSGYTLLNGDRVVSPHSDHIRMIYAYGLIPYFLLMKMILSKIKIDLSYIYFIPAFIAFSINSIMDEQRFMYMFAVLFAVSLASMFRDKKTEYSAINKRSF